MDINDVSYVGIFFPHINGSLPKDIPLQHVTLAFQPNEEKFAELLPLLRTPVEISVLGYGNDGRNEGLLVKVPDEVPYFGAEKQHITLSLYKSSAVKTGFIDFTENIPESISSQLPEKMIGHIAVFTKDKNLVYDASKFAEFTQFKSELADDVLGDETHISNTQEQSVPDRDYREMPKQNTECVSL